VATSADAVDWGLSHIAPTTIYSTVNRQSDPADLEATGGLIKSTDCSGFVTLCLRAIGIFDALYVPYNGSIYGFMYAGGRLTNVSNCPGTGVGGVSSLGKQDWKFLYKVLEWDMWSGNAISEAGAYISNLIDNDGIQKGDIIIRYPFAPTRSTKSAGHIAFINTFDGTDVTLLEALAPGPNSIGERTLSWEDALMEFNLILRPCPAGNTSQYPGPTYL
jgi:hypothetical protein